MKKSYRGFTFYAILLVALFLIMQMFTASVEKEQGIQIDSAQLLEYVQQDQVQEILIRTDVAYARLKGSTSQSKLSPQSFDVCAVVEESSFLSDCKQLVSERTGKDSAELTSLDLGFALNYMQPASNPWYMQLLPYAVMLLIFGVFWMFMMNRQNGGKMMNFGRSTARTFEPGGNPVKFSDVAGAEEEKEEMQELVDFLKDPKRFTDLGARIPKGVLLVGPPGTGKTLLARAVAGEAGVPFMTISGSDFVEMFVGVGASRVRDLFDQAKHRAPCIVFIDEIDAVGRKRGAGLGGGHDEREQTLNQLLVEMDGFAANEGVIVLAATNRKDILDPALLRPGRFDRQITVGLPDVKGREAILRVHCRNKPLAEDVDLANVAKRTPYMAGADLANVVNEAAILCARAGGDKITARQMSEAVERVQMGPEKKSHVITEEDKRLVACHEAGHAIVGELLPGCDQVHLITIMPRGGSGGHTLLLPEQESSYTTRTQLLDFVAMALGGYAAETLVRGEMSTGASSDLQRATEICRNMVTKYGMSSDMGPIYLGSKHDEVFLALDYGHEEKQYSDELAARIDLEVQEKMNTALERALSILKSNREKLDGLTDLLIEKETIDRAEFMKFMEEKKPEKFFD